MVILAGIMIVAGLVLLMVGKNVSQYLPPNYNGEDDGFLELMNITGRVIQVAGAVLVVIGVLVIVLFR